MAVVLDAAGSRSLEPVDLGFKAGGRQDLWVLTSDVLYTISTLAFLPVYLVSVCLRQTGNDLGVTVQVLLQLVRRQVGLGICVHQVHWLEVLDVLDWVFIGVSSSVKGLSRYGLGSHV